MGIRDRQQVRFVSVTPAGNVGAVQRTVVFIGELPSSKIVRHLNCRTKWVNLRTKKCSYIENLCTFYANSYYTLARLYE